MPAMRSLSIAICLLLQTTALAAAAPPNVIVILADDIGYGDLSCYGATKVATPNLDRLASEGMRFTDAHSPAAVCTPSRYGLLTGRYPWRHPPASRILSGVAPLSIEMDRTTLASFLKQAGYRTGVVGKWHLGLGSGPTDYNHIDRGPTNVGFEYSFIIPATGDRTPCVYVENERVVGYDPADPIQVSYGKPVGDEPTGAAYPELLKVKPSHGHDNTIVAGISRIGYMTGGQKARWHDDAMADDITQRAVAFVESDKPGPFFLYFATHDIHVPRVPHSRFAGSSQCGTRGDVIQELDWSVGQLLEALDRRKIAGETLVIFSSDNGGVMDDGYEDVGRFDYHPNAPLRGTKGTLYEGGHRVPLLARWPGHVPAGAVSDALVAGLDFFAAFAALTNQPMPKDGAGDSFDILPTLLGQTTVAPVRPHFVAHIGGTQGPFALRSGTWKLIEAGKGGYGKAAKASADKQTPGKQAAAKPGTAPERDRFGTKPQLFQLADDLAEANDLAAAQPERLAELQTLLKKIRETPRSVDVR